MKTLIITCLLAAVSLAAESQDNIPGKRQRGASATLPARAMPASSMYHPDAVVKRTYKLSHADTVMNFGSGRPVTKNGTKLQTLSQNSTAAAVTNSGIPATTTDPNSIIKPVVVYPSPNVGSLASNIDQTVDLYTGKLNLNIPLYTLQSKDITVPVSLSYHGGNGIKVNELSGATGLGWDMIAGGSISRVMHDLPDETDLDAATVNNPVHDAGSITAPAAFLAVEIGYLNLKNRASKDLNAFGALSYNDQALLIDYTNFPIRSLTPDCVNGNAACPNPIVKFDTQPDEFYFNFGQYSGKFVFDQDGNINTIPKQNLKIEKTIQTSGIKSKIVQFVVTTPDGVKYTFGDANFLAVEESRLHHEDQVIAEFEYRCSNTSGIASTANGIPITIYPYDRTPYIHTYSIDCNQPPVYDDFSRGKNFSATDIDFFPTSWYLSSILSPTGDMVSFNYEATAANPVVYLQNSSLTSNYPNLSEFQFADGWHFESLLGPNHEACKTYFTFPMFQSLVYSTDWVYLKGRRLKTIVTKNNYQVRFDALTARNDIPGDKRLDKVSIYDNNNNLLKYFSLNYTENYNSEPIFPAIAVYPQPNNSALGYQIQTFSLEPEEADKYRLFLNSVTETAADGTGKPPIQLNYFDKNIPPRFSINQDQWGYNKVNMTGFPLIFNSYIGNGGDVVPRSNLNIFSWGIFDGSKPVPAWGTDNYLPTDNPNAITSGLLKQVVYPTGGIKEFTYEPNVAGTTTVGGLRISQQKDYTAPGVQAYKETTYKYTNGASVNPLVTGYQLLEYENDNKSIFDSRVFATDKPFYGLETTKGGLVGYGQVDVAQAGNGKTTYNFYNPSDHPDSKTVITQLYNGATSTDAYPFPKNTDKDFQRGLIHIETVFDETGKTVNKKTYNYNFAPANYTVTHSPGLVGTQSTWNEDDNFHTGGFLPFKWYLAAPFTYDSNWFFLSDITENVYDTNQNLSTTTTSYFYDNPIHQLLTRTESLNSRNDLIQQKNKYVGDEGTISGLTTTELDAVNKLKTQFRYTTLLEKEENRNGVLSSRVRNGFKDWGNGLIMQESVKIQKAANAMEPRLTYQAYDNTNGNIMQYAKDSDAPVAFIWGYQKQYPVAQVLNAAAKDIYYDSFEEGNGTSVLNDSKTGHYSFSGAYQPKITGLDNGIYKMTYWKKTGTSWTLQVTDNISVTTNLYQFNISGQIDDVRFYPQNAQMTTYTFDPMIGMTSETNANSEVTYYDYDNFQRLKSTRDKDGNVVKSYTYHYKGQ